MVGAIFKSRSIVGGATRPDALVNFEAMYRDEGVAPTGSKYQ